MALSPPGATSLIQATYALRDMAQSDVAVTRSVSNEFGAAQDIVIGNVEKICLNSKFCANLFDVHVANLSLTNFNFIFLSSANVVYLNQATFCVSQSGSSPVPIEVVFKY